MEDRRFERSQPEPQLSATVIDMNDVIFLVAFNFPVLVPDPKAIGRRAGGIAVATLYSFAEGKLLGANVRQREMRHIKLVEERRFFAIGLPVAQSKAKKRHLVAKALAALRVEMTGVIPPLGFEIGVRIVIGRETQRSPRQGELVGKTASK